MRFVHARAQSMFGITLLEALVAVIVFSIGVLGIVGLHQRSAQAVSDAVVRAAAAAHARDLVNQIRLTDPALRRQGFDASGGGNRLARWLAAVRTGPMALPGAGLLAQEVTIRSSSYRPRTDRAGSSAQAEDADATLHATRVEIVLYWRAADGSVARYATQARLSETAT